MQSDWRENCGTMRVTTQQSRRKQAPPRPTRQRGAIMLLLALLLVITGSWLGLRMLATPKAISGVRASDVALKEARDAILGATGAATAANVLIAGVNSPGRLPAPDFLDPAGGNVYDGRTNGACARSTWTAGATLVTLGGPSGIATSLRCFGRLPWTDLGLGTYAAVAQNDPLGQIPWYAISANLTDACVNALNPSILDTSLAAFALSKCDLVLPPSRPFAWLTVRDAKGNLVTDRAAVVLVMPGPPVGTQSRPVNPQQGPAAYLDSVTVAATCTQPCLPGTYNNARFNWPDNIGLSFIQCAQSGQVAATDTNYTQPYNCNDRVVYITIDELMEIAERRAAQYLADVLRAYYATNRYFPFAAPLAQLTPKLRGQCEVGAVSGLAPTIATTTAPTVPANPNPCPHPEFSSQVLGWFNTNSWGDYIVYNVAADCTQPTPAASGAADCGGASGVRLAAGAVTNARAILISAGAPIVLPPFAASKASAQSRPSSSLLDYLDSTENTNLDNRFDAPTSALSRSFNDKTVVVAP